MGMPVSLSLSFDGSGVEVHCREHRGDGSEVPSAVRVADRAEYLERLAQGGGTRSGVRGSGQYRERGQRGIVQELARITSAHPGNTMPENR
jgi:hypothetical protein